ncbi:hypothetical protein DXG01_011702 [Tephrocybe rancida]|nr:hypothetical protein DXG01_011702 [Tephrocybe rancida]
MGLNYGSPYPLSVVRQLLLFDCHWVHRGLLVAQFVPLEADVKPVPNSFTGAGWSVGLLALFPLTGAYPLMKRITYWPQAWLGLAINIGISMAWATTTSSIPPNSLVLSAGSFFWTLWYGGYSLFSTLERLVLTLIAHSDTIYACQDKKDDVAAGIKSTALLFGSHVKQILAIFGTIFMTALTISGIMSDQSLPFFVVSVFGGALHLTWQLYTVDVDSPGSCWRTFEANGFYFGAVVEAGLALDYLMSLN